LHAALVDLDLGTERCHSHERESVVSFETSDDAEFERLTADVAAEKPGSREALAAFLDMRAREWRSIEEAIGEVPSVGTVVREGPPAAIPPLRYDTLTGDYSGGSVNHNRPPGMAPWEPDPI
jgi:hypothetical protein